jgi:hypothetical protein
MRPEEWDRLVPGEDYRWDEAMDAVVVAPPVRLRGKVVDGWEVAYNPPASVVAKAKAHARSPMP